eukprot:3174665-Rhodomonas_salina.2
MMQGAISLIRHQFINAPCLKYMLNGGPGPGPGSEFRNPKPKTNALVSASTSLPTSKLPPVFQQ